MTHNLVAAAGVSALLLAASQAAPLTAAEAGTMTVKIGDLRLGAAPGAQRAYKRIRMAAAEFCGDDRSFRRLKQNAEISRCKARMTYLAVSKLDAPMVTALYAKSGQQPPILLASR